eukprot:c23453_g1_i1 orf=491-670(+)
MISKSLGGSLDESRIQAPRMKPRSPSCARSPTQTSKKYSTLAQQERNEELWHRLSLSLS